MNDVTVEHGGQELRLNRERAVFWSSCSTLLVSDVHLGKESVFGRHGLAIPDGATSRDLDRLAELVACYRAERLVVLGDLVHATPSGDAQWPQLLSSWLTKHSELSVAVVAGNHDRRAAREALDRRIEWHVAPLVEPPFVFAHETGDALDGSGYALTGHLHPVVRLGDRRGDRLRCPVFWFRDDHAVLPAFGTFTGGYAVRPAAADRVFAVGPDDVLEL